VNGLRSAPASVSSSTQLRRAYSTAAMALHAAEDKTFRGASIAGFATPWGDYTNEDNLNDGYHRVWGRDLYQQASGLIAAGDSSQTLRMAQFLWNSQFISTITQGAGTKYAPGALSRYSPVSGINGASQQDLGCCEQFDQEAFAIVLAWMTGLADNATYQKIQATANHIQAAGPATTERWEEQFGKSLSSICGGDRRRSRGGGYRPPERQHCQCSQLGDDSRLVAVQPLRLDVHDQRLLGRPPVLRAHRPNVEPKRHRSDLLQRGLLLRARRGRLRVSRSGPARRSDVQRFQRLDVGVTNGVGVGR
jgi:hypothetical protein